MSKVKCLTLVAGVAESLHYGSEVELHKDLLWTAAFLEHHLQHHWLNIGCLCILALHADLSIITN